MLWSAEKASGTLLAWLKWEVLNFDNTGQGTNHMFSVVVVCRSLWQFYHGRAAGFIKVNTHLYGGKFASFSAVSKGRQPLGDSAIKI